MSDKPTDFNDLAQVQGVEALGVQITKDLHDITVDRRREVDAPAQLSEGVKAVSDMGNVVPFDKNSNLPNENAARDDEFERVWRGKFERTNSGSLKGSVRNTELVLRHDKHWAGVLGLCEFSHRVLKLKPPPMSDSCAGEWNDMDAGSLRLWLAEQYGFTPNHGDVTDALVTVARSNSFHPVREYLESIKWDGVPRLKDWLRLAFDSTEPEGYLALVGPKILVGAVARVMRPGCKAEEVMILEGRQGRGKSTVISILFGDWFSDSPLPIGKVAAQELIQGKWCFEIAELDAFHKAEVTALKQFLSQQIDRFRPAYGRSALDFPRQTQFWGSTNQDTYLRDYTGNRRFWPVFCATVNKEWVREHRDQLWAEALQLYENKFQWWVSRETPEREAEWLLVTDVQDSRMQADPWEGLLIKFFAKSVNEYFHAHEILEGIGVDGGHQTQAHVNRIAPILRSLGWKNTRKRIPDGNGRKVQARVWINQDLLDEVPLSSDKNEQSGDELWDM
ncbi:MAG: virulence-associated E family protein [Gammaproteobacteria bacterium]|nr:virulence-associated E family protein [Gammaproteobacteria bacterium]